MLFVVLSKRERLTLTIKSIKLDPIIGYMECLHKEKWVKAYASYPPLF